MKLTIGLLLIVTLNSGCAIPGSEASNCVSWKAIYSTAATIDAMTEQEAKAVLGHNEYGKKQGCW